MSENNTPSAEELVEEISYEVEDASVIPTPIDPTLSISGEAADAKATGDAIAAVLGDLRINTKAPVNSAVTLYATDILMSSEEGAQTISEAFGGVEDKDASEIMYDSTNLVTVKDAIDGIITDMETGITDEEIDEIIDEVFGGES